MSDEQGIDLIRETGRAIDAGAGSAALVMMRDGAVVCEHGLGVADADTGAPVDVGRTRYQLASVSKAVAAWGVMALAQRGEIDLDEPVVRRLTRWRLRAERGTDPRRVDPARVTVRQLLSHTAGLDDDLGYLGFGPGEPAQSLEASLEHTRDVIHGAARGVRVAREPGTAWRYSGGGYTILQLLVEEIVGRPFAEAMASLVLRPLGMDTATFSFDDLVEGGRVVDLATSFDLGRVATSPRRYTASAAASLYATPRDLGRFLQAHVRPNPVLEPDTLREMWAPAPAATEGGRPVWGLGVKLFARDGPDGFVVGHDGHNVPALCHTVRVSPATGHGIAVLTSGDPDLASRLADAWLTRHGGGPGSA